MIFSSTSGVQRPYQVPSGITAAIGPPLQIPQQPIFSRSTPLGNVHEKSLSELMEGDVAVDLNLDEAILASHGLRSQMTCWECRLRNALLASEPLVQLGKGNT